MKRSRRRPDCDSNCATALPGKFHQIELTAGGVGVLDYNNDGCTDIFFTNGAAIPSLRKTGPEFYNRLFRNNCDLTFTDVTAEAGLAGEGYSDRSRRSAISTTTASPTSSWPA